MIDDCPLGVNSWKDSDSEWTKLLCHFRTLTGLPPCVPVGVWVPPTEASVRALPSLLHHRWPLGIWGANSLLGTWGVNSPLGMWGVNSPMGTWGVNSAGAEHTEACLDFVLENLQVILQLKNHFPVNLMVLKIKIKEPAVGRFEHKITSIHPK